jgi:hypothetical protein
VHETDQSVRAFRWDDKSVAERAAQAAHEAKGGDADAEAEIPVDIEAAAKDGKTPEQRFTEYLQQRFAQAVTMRSDAAQILPGVKHALCLITCNYLNEYEGHGRTILVCVPKDEAAAALKASAQ